MSDEPEGADFQARAIQERPKALQVELVETGDVKWIPKSVIHSESEVFEISDEQRASDEDAEPAKLIVYLWFAEQEKWL